MALWFQFWVSNFVSINVDKLNGALSLSAESRRHVVDFESALAPLYRDMNSLKQINKTIKIIDQFLK